MTSRRPAALVPALPAAGLAVLALALFCAGAAAAGPAVPTFAGNAQHTAVYDPPAQDLAAIRWSTPIDESPGAFAHYGAPVLTAANTLITPVLTSTDGFRLAAFAAADGTLKYTLATDYVLPSHQWIPVYQPALATGAFGTRLYYPGVGGTVYRVDNPDSAAHGAPVQQVFYTSLATYQANKAAFDTSVFIDTPIAPDAQGNVFFGFRVQGTAPAPLSTTQSGFARIDPAGNATYVLAGNASGDANAASDSHNSAPALSNDGTTVYVVAKAPGGAYGYLLALDSTNLATKHSVRLKDPRNDRVNDASIPDDGTASPTVAPDGDVYLGVNTSGGSRGFLLHWRADLTVEKVPGGFGWDNTAAIVPASMVPSYTGPSSYLIFTKYNDYTFGGDGGQGVNRIALLDPATSQIDAHASSSGLPILREVLTAIGPTPDAEHRDSFPDAVREWCINTAAVNPATHSVFAPSEDGHLYRWNLQTNSLDQLVRLTAGVGEPYVPTVIGPDGTVFTLNGGTLFAVGELAGVRVTLASSSPDDRDGVPGRSLTWTATVAGTGSPGAVPTGTVTFSDTVYFLSGPGQLSSSTTVLAANVPLGAAGHASFTSSALSATNHFITARYNGDARFAAGEATLVQTIHPGASTTSVTSTPNPSNPGQAVTVTATVAPVTPASSFPTGLVTFSGGNTVLAQLAVDASGTASFTTNALGQGLHPLTAVYASDPHFAASQGSTSQTVISPATRFFTVVSCRVLDTREALGPWGGPALMGGVVRTFVLAGRCGIPATARAVLANLTVIAPSVGGSLGAWAADTTDPATPVLSFRAGQVRSNNTVLSLSQDGTGSVDMRPTASGGTLHLVLDVSGYYAP